jgi:hypothetical protein
MFYPESKSPRKYTLDSRPKRIYVYLRIIGEDLDPTAVSKLLKLTPSRSWSANDLRLSLAEEPVVSEGGWSLSSLEFVRSNKLEEHMQWLLEQLQGRALALRQLAGQNCRAELIIHWVAGSWNTSCSLSGTTLKAISKYQIPVYFDVWEKSELSPP